MLHTHKHNTPSRKEKESSLAGLFFLCTGSLFLLTISSSKYSVEISFVCSLSPSFANTHVHTLSVSHTRTFSHTLCLTHTHIFTHSLLAGGTWTIFIHNTLRENMSIMKKRAGTSPFFSTNTFARNLTSSFPTVFKNETSFFYFTRIIDHERQKMFQLSEPVFLNHFSEWVVVASTMKMSNHFVLTWSN